MKKYLILIFLVGFQIIFAQTENAKIQKDFELMIEFILKNQFDKVIDMTYPRFVKIFSKDGLTKMTTGMLTSMGIKFIVEENPINLKMSTLIKLKDGPICMASTTTA